MLTIIKLDFITFIVICPCLVHLHVITQYGSTAKNKTKFFPASASLIKAKDVWNVKQLISKSKNKQVYAENKENFLLQISKYVY